MTTYRIVNTDTGSVLAGPFPTLDEAEARMLAEWPVSDPWDGVEVPVAIEEVPQ